MGSRPYGWNNQMWVKNTIYEMCIIKYQQYQSIDLIKQLITINKSNVDYINFSSYHGNIGCQLSPKTIVYILSVHNMIGCIISWRVCTT